MDGFKNSIHEANLDTEGGAEELVLQYNTKLRVILDTHAPLNKKTITKRPNAPWYTDELHQEKHKRRKLFHQWLRSKLEIHHQLYRQQCIVVAKLLHITQAAYYSDKTESCGQDMK